MCTVCTFFVASLQYQCLCIFLLVKESYLQVLAAIAYFLKEKLLLPIDLDNLFVSWRLVYWCSNKVGKREFMLTLNMSIGGGGPSVYTTFTFGTNGWDTSGYVYFDLQWMYSVVFLTQRNAKVLCKLPQKESKYSCEARARSLSTTSWNDVIVCWRIDLYYLGVFKLLMSDKSD